MIFRFLRQYLNDDEYEDKHAQLIEVRNLLNECKATLQFQKDAEGIEKEKVDADFLTLVWASIAAALALGSEAISNLPEKKILFTTPSLAIWSVLVLAAFFFTIISLVTAINLTMKYARFKKDSDVRTFSFSLLIGMTILTIGLFIISWLASKGITTYPELLKAISIN